MDRKPSICGQGWGPSRYLDELLTLLFHNLQFPREIGWGEGGEHRRQGWRLWEGQVVAWAGQLRGRVATGQN